MRLSTQSFPSLYKLFATSNNARLFSQRGKCSASAKLSSPSADRNSQPIADALRPQLDLKTTQLKLLEISSGTGQHAGFLGPLFPNIVFQPTEYDRTSFGSIRAYAEACPAKNILPPVYVDVSEDPSKWPEREALQPPGSYDYMFNSNLMHISPWSCSLGLFRAAGKMLKPKGLLFTYGPYAVNGVLEPQSNVDFDRSLKNRNPEYGVRDIADLKQVAADNGLELKQIIDMPSNNKLLIWLKA